MVNSPLLQLTDMSLKFGDKELFLNLNMLIKEGDRAALIGCNGSGKSTLLKIISGQIEADCGSRVVSKGTAIGYMEQDPNLNKFLTLYDFAVSSLDPSNYYKVEHHAETLGISLEIKCKDASGGERRRASLVKLFAEESDLLLLDEPTNHLDIEGILWLERKLISSKYSFLIISHDRTFLNNLTKQTFWVDRAVVRKRELGFITFEDWRDKIWKEEDQESHKLDMKIKAEARWAVEGISGRRKRNMGRLRALHNLRETKFEKIKRQSLKSIEIDTDIKSGQKVIEAKDISKAFDGNEIIRKFSLKVARGERIAIVGSNGVGKSTLINMLTGKVPPDSGKVKMGTDLYPAIFDQNREILDDDLSLWENLTSDPITNVSNASDQVMVRGRPRHVMGYLKEFLFSEIQARMPVGALSGGEKARLMLAKILSKSSNLLVLDEPTNDFDLETLDLLQEALDEYLGTVILVSHDRDFINRVSTKTLVMLGDGLIREYNGGWSDIFLKDSEKSDHNKSRTKTKKKLSHQNKQNSRIGLSFTQSHRLQKLPEEIERLSGKISELELILSDGDLYSKDEKRFLKLSKALTLLQNKLTLIEDEWLKLEELSETKVN